MKTILIAFLLVSMSNVVHARIDTYNPTVEMESYNQSVKDNNLRRRQQEQDRAMDRIRDAQREQEFKDFKEKLYRQQQNGK